MRRYPPPTHRLAAALVALALALLGFGHARAPAAPADPALAAWVQAGFAAEDLCRADPGAPHEDAPGTCPVCTLAKGAALLPAPALPRPADHRPARSRPAPGAVVAGCVGPRLPPARGPPSA